MTLETRVGKATLNCVANELEEYIKTYTKNGRYEGKLHYLIKYVNVMEYMRK